MRAPLLPVIKNCRGFKIHCMFTARQWEYRFHQSSIIGKATHWQTMATHWQTKATHCLLCHVTISACCVSRLQTDSAKWSITDKAYNSVHYPATTLRVPFPCCVAVVSDWHWHIIVLYRSKFRGSGNINPLTAPDSKYSGLKSAYIQACKQHVWWSYNSCAFW